MRNAIPSTLVLLLALLSACGRDAPEAAEATRVVGDAETATEAAKASRPIPGAAPASEADSGDEAELERIRASVLDEMQVFSGDLDGMFARKTLRVATTFSRTQFFLDGPQPRGAVYDLVMEFIKALNEGRPARERIHAVFVPVARDELLPALLEGKADLAIAQLTITPERRSVVDFSDPFSRGVSEIVVTGPSAPDLATLDDLAGKSVHVRRSSSYYESLVFLSEALEARGLEPVDIVAVDELLEPEDILELVANGVYPMTVVSDYLAELWSQVLDGLVPREDLAVASERDIAWAFRKESPRLKRAVNEFVAGHRQGTLIGNVVINRYYRDSKWVRNPLAGEDQVRFEGLADIFQRYAERYEVDWLLAIAQGYQESRLDQSVRSSAGAVGIMQIKPSTAADPNVGIPDVQVAEKNVHAGIKYLTFLRERYFSSADIDPFQQVLFSLAAYNAGPARVAQYRRQAAERGLDPDRWILNVEQVANRETARYVRNIVKYYVSYREYARRVAALKASESERT